MIPVAVRQRPAYDDQLDEPAALTVRVDCPAKTNLTLEVGPTHDEWGGRHELDTIYCAIGVYDTITATAKHPGAGFSLELEGAHLGDLASSSSDMRRNHAVLALFAMAQARFRCGIDHHQTHPRRRRSRRRLGRRGRNHTGRQSAMGITLANGTPAYHCRHTGR